jgi:hypothetical protein
LQGMKFFCIFCFVGFLVPFTERFRHTTYVFFIPLYFLALRVSGAICSHPQEHKLQRRAIGVYNDYGTLIHWSRNLTVLKVWGCPSQYLLQWINIPKPLHTRMSVLCSLCSWGWVQIAPETCRAKSREK